jgi:ribonuclease HI
MNKTETQRSIVIYTDGGARGNPGPAGIGIVMYADDGAGNQTLVGEIKRYIGEQTNNYAEYFALITGLEEALKLGYTNISCFLDSELVVKQMLGLYKVKEATLQKMHATAKALVAQFASVKFTHVRREKNAGADALVNQALDEESGDNA